jgi:hypothetical protein
MFATQLLEKANVGLLSADNCAAPCWRDWTPGIVQRCAKACGPRRERAGESTQAPLDANSTWPCPMQTLSFRQLLAYGDGCSSMLRVRRLANRPFDFVRPAW